MESEMRNLMHIVQDLTLLKEGQTLDVAIMRSPEWDGYAQMVGMISMRKEFNETYGDHIRADYIRIVEGSLKHSYGERVWMDDHVWSGCEVDAVMTMDITYRGDCENTKLETYRVQDLRMEGE